MTQVQTEQLMTHEKVVEIVELVIKELTANKNNEPVTGDACHYCAYEDMEEWEMPCTKCKHGCKSYWREKA